MEKYFGAEWRKLLASLSGSSNKLFLYIFAAANRWHVRYSLGELKIIDYSISVLGEEVQVLEEFFEKYMN
jgi:hypothetical protein